jgi:hypothetical protein
MRVSAALALGASAAALLFAPAALAQSVIRQPGVHPDYHFEAEPHLLLAIDPPGKGGGAGFGPGFRGTIEIVDNGFISKINNTVGVGFGADYVALTAKGDPGTFIIPVVMQWNFWFDHGWSVFGEPDGALVIGDKLRARPAGFGGARYHFNESIALTLRAGYPAVSVGVSFLL